MQQKYTIHALILELLKNCFFHKKMLLEHPCIFLSAHLRISLSLTTKLLVSNDSTKN